MGVFAGGSKTGATDTTVAPFGAKSKTSKPPKQANQTNQAKQTRKSREPVDLRSNEKISLDAFFDLCFPMDKIITETNVILYSVFVKDHVFVPSLGIDLFNSNFGKIEIDLKKNTIKIWSITPDDETSVNIRMKEAKTAYAYSHNIEIEDVKEKDVVPKQIDPNYVIEGFLSL